MLGREIWIETRQNLKGRSALCALLILLIFVLSNFVMNVKAFSGSDILDMYHPMKMLFLSYDRTFYYAGSTLMFVQLYPFLAVMPAGFSLASEKRAGSDVYFAARIGRERYFATRVLSAFTTTALVFAIPFAVDYLLAIISFPLEATGDFFNMSIYTDEYIEMVERYLFPEFMCLHPYIYAALAIVAFCVFSGFVGAFTVALSGVWKPKYNFLLFLPALVLLYGSVIVSNLTGLPVSWDRYLLLFDSTYKIGGMFIAGVLILVAVTVMLCRAGKKKDI